MEMSFQIVFSSGGIGGNVGNELALYMGPSKIFTVVGSTHQLKRSKMGIILSYCATKIKKPNLQLASMYFVLLSYFSTVCISEGEDVYKSTNTIIGIGV